MPKRTFILALSHLFLVPLLFAQPQIEHIQQLSFKEGLSDRAVQHITQDSKGFLWIATENGLNRYTGTGFEIFDNNTYSKFKIQENDIRETVEVEGGKLVLTNSRKEHFIELIDLESFASRVVQLNSQNGIGGVFKAIFAEPMGRVWALAEKEGNFIIYQMNADFGFDEAHFFTFPHKNKAGEVRFIRSKQGHFWVMDSNNGLLDHSPTNDRTRHFPLDEITQLTTLSEISYSTSILHEDLVGRLWVAFPFRNGLLNPVPGEDRLAVAEGFPKKELYSGMWEDCKGHLLIGTFQSFGKLNKVFALGREGQPVSADWITAIDDKISHIYGRDFDQIMFLGTFVGVYKIKMKEQPIRWVLADRQLADGEWGDGISIRSITGDGHGNIYIGRELKAWYKLSVPTMKLDSLHVDDADGNPVRLWCNSNVVYDRAGVLWGGSCAEDRGGLLHRHDLVTGATKTFPIPNKVIMHIVQQENRELILASGADDSDGLLLFFDPEKELLTQYMDADGTNPFIGRKPQFVLMGKGEKIWLGTDEGLIKIDRNTKTSSIYNRKNSHLTNDNIITIHEANDGKIMLGTYGGLNILDVNSGQVESYNKENGLCNNTVCGILPDGEGNYFLSTFYGLSFFNTSTKLFSNFFQEKGLTFNEFNRLAFYKDENETYYFGTLNGVNVFKKNDLLGTAEKAFPLQWIKVTKNTDEGDQQVWDHDFSSFKKIVLRQKDDFVKFEFCLPHYSKPEQNRYAVKLEGRDATWRLLNSATEVNINRPPPGDYRFRVKTAPALGDWLEGELSLDIQVKQAVYQRPWFQVALPLVILLLSYLASLWFVGGIRQKEGEQTRINKKFAELELQALQAQMNPHFVFNALGAIQYFIQKNNAEAADNYLAKFAKLMRLFLESSKNKYITLAEEIKLLSLYVELEQMRFENKFDAKITVDDDLDIHSRELPSILIQPFVENAINHGLFHKKGKGHLSIEFQENQQGTLSCIIQDDGVGRKKADHLKLESNRTHKSRGMQIVRERLEVLQQVDEISIMVKIEDLYPDEEETGTVVQVEIPDLE